MYSLALFGCLLPVAVCAAGSAAAEGAGAAGERIGDPQPSPGGMTAQLVREGEAGAATLVVRDPAGRTVAAWDGHAPGGGLVIGRPVWIDDRWLLVRTRSGALSSGALYLSVDDGQRVGVTWVETHRPQPAGVRQPLYAEVSFWTPDRDGWQRQPTVLLDDRPIFPVTFPAKVSFAAWRLDSPAYARVLLRAVESYRKQEREGLLPGGLEGLSWRGRAWAKASPDGSRAALCVGREGEAGAFVMLLGLDAPDTAPRVSGVSFLPTNIPAEHEGIEVSWLDRRKLRLDAILPGTATPLTQTLTVPER